MHTIVNQWKTVTVKVNITIPILDGNINLTGTGKNIGIICLDFCKSSQHFIGFY